MAFVQGDNGRKLPFSVDKDIDLTNAIIEITINRAGVPITKTATIVSENNCEVILNSDVLTVAGIYKYQWSVKYDDGRKTSGNISDFYVSEKVTNISGGDPGTGDIIVSVDGGEF